MENAWFRDWFNSPYYHMLYHQRDEKEAHYFITNLCNFLQLPERSFIWDLACGKGRHSVALSKKGFQVTGTDLSEKSIEEAMAQKEHDVEFYIHDMRLPFRINYFDCVMNLFTSIGYFENENDNYKVFKNAWQALKPNGFFVVDFFNADKVIQSLHPHCIEQRKDITFDITRKIVNNTVHKTINFEHANKTYSFNETVSLFKRQDFERFAAKSGFVLEKIFGDYGLNEFDTEKSDRLILIFRK